MIDEFAKQYLHNELRGIRSAMLGKLDGLSEYDIRRPLRMRRAQKSSSGSNVCASTPTQPSMLCQSIHPATCRGGRVPNVKLFNVLVHLVAETNRHAGHADILREQIDGRTGLSDDESSWAHRFAKIEQAARVRE